MNKQLETNIQNTYGILGLDWLEKIPELIKECSELWKLKDLKPLATMGYNYILSGWRDLCPIVLKLGPEPWSLAQEARALEAFDNLGCVRLLAQKEGALLLERATSLETLRSYFSEHENKSLAIFCELTSSLHQAKIHESFLNISDWLVEIDNNWDIPDRYLKKARMLKKELLDSLGPLVLLHGDLHHDNILRHEPNFIAIDPKGILGEALYEAGVFVRSPHDLLAHNPKAEEIIKSRIVYISNYFNAKPERLLCWCFVQAVLAWIWAIQDNHDIQDFKKITEILYKLLD